MCLVLSPKTWRDTRYLGRSGCSSSAVQLGAELSGDRTGVKQQNLRVPNSFPSPVIKDSRDKKTGIEQDYF